MTDITNNPPFTGEILEFGQSIVGSKRELKTKKDVDQLLKDSCSGYPPEIKPVLILDANGNKLTVENIKALLTA